MLRFALGVAGRGGLRSPDESSLTGVAEGALRACVAEAAGLAAARAVADGEDDGAPSVAPGEGCSAAPGEYTRTATEASPKTRPAAAAAKIVQRERPGRCEAGPDVSMTLATYGASLSGAWLDGGSDSMTGGTDLTGGA